MAWFRTFLGDRRGAAAAEMALVLPLLVALMFVTFEGGYFLWNQHKVVKGVRDGARYAARLAFSNYAGCTPVGSTPLEIDGTAPATRIKHLTRTGKTSGGTPVVYTWTDDDDVVVTCHFVDDAGGLYATNSGVAPHVTVSAQVPYPESPITSLAEVFGFDPSGVRLKASAQSPVMGL